MQQNRDNRVLSLDFLTLLPPFFTPPFSSRFSSRTRAAGCLGTREDDLGVVINEAGGLKNKNKSLYNHLDTYTTLINQDYLN